MTSRATPNVRLLCGVACILIAQPAWAQAGGTDSNAEAEDFTDANVIVVTGITKRAENIQDVPTTITAYSGDQLETQGLRDVASIATFTPGFNIRAGGNNPTALNLQMRGQIQNDTLATLEPSVGVYLDEMYVARAYGLNADLVDIESVQVLKGPQGTLFGRNTSAGALLIKTNVPRFGEFSAALKGTYGRYNERAGTAVLNLGIGERVAVRGALHFAQRDDYQTDVRRAGATYGGRETLNGRAKLSLNITDTLNLLVSGEWFDGEIDGPARRNLLYIAPNGTDRAAADRALLGDDPDNVAITPLATYPGAPANDIFNDIATQTYVANLSLDTFFGEAKLIGGYRRIKGNNIIDLDGSSAGNAHFSQARQDLEQYSGELQFTGTAAAEVIEFAAGLTYFREAGFDLSRTSTNNSPTWTGFSGTINNDSFGIYSQVSLNATDRLRLNGGARYSIDDKGVTTQSAAFPNNGTVPSVCLPASFTGDNNGDGAFTSEDCNRGRSDTFRNLSYTVGFDYDVTDDVLFYAKHSKGYRSGAQQLRSLTLTDTTPAAPEIVHEQEVGLKSQFLDGRVTLNVAGFHNKVRDAQRSVILSVGGIQQTILENASLENWGVEADAAVEVVEGLTLLASGSWLDPEYTSYQGFVVSGGVLTPIDKSGFRLVGIVEKQFTLGANYDADLGLARLNLNATYAWQDEFAQDANRAQDYINNGVPAASAQAYVDATTTPSLETLNARAAVAFGPHDKFEVAVWGRNLLDDRVPLYALYLGGLNYVSAAYNDPRTYGVTVSVKFGGKR